MAVTPCGHAMVTPCGLCCRVNVGHYRALVNMGFTEQLATRALREANNNLDGALQVNQRSNKPEPGSLRTFAAKTSNVQIIF